MAVNEMTLLSTFKNWPLTYGPSPQQLSRSGFMYTGAGDIVKCSLCNTVISDWKDGDIADVEHMKWSNNCPLFANRMGKNAARNANQLTNNIVGHSEAHLANASWMPSNYTAGQEETHLANAFSNIGVQEVTEPQPNTRNSSGLQSYSTPSMPNQDSSKDHLKSERNRFLSFANWPTSSPIDPKDLAKAGLHYLGVGDCVRCIFCQGTLKEWESGDVPEVEHRKFYKNCPFLQNPLAVGNIPLQNAQIVHSEDDFHNFQTRLNSFTGRQLPVGQSAEGLAEAGFYHVGPGDSVKCFSCGGCLREWEASDNPWTEHACWFPRCTFLEQSKGQDFINSVRKRYSIRQNKLLSSQISDIVSAVIERGHSKETVENIYKEKFLSKNIRIVSFDQLLEAVEQHTQTNAKFSPAILQEENLDVHAVLVPSARSATFHPLAPPSASAASPSHGQEVGSGRSSPASEVSSIGTISSLSNQSQSFNVDIMMCKICFEAPVDTLILPCNHLVCCRNCSPQLTLCPICRGAIGNTMRVFMS